MTEPKAASIGSNQAPMDISLMAITAIDKAIGIPRIAGEAVLYATLAASSILSNCLKQRDRELHELRIFSRQTHHT